MTTYMKTENGYIVVSEADIFTREQWQKLVDYGAMIPDDGRGYWAKEIDGLFFESKVDCFSAAPEDATHVAWYNK